MKNEWINEWKNEWINEWISWWMNEWIDEWLIHNEPFCKTKIAQLFCESLA